MSINFPDFSVNQLCGQPSNENIKYISNVPVTIFQFDNIRKISPDDLHDSQERNFNQLGSAITHINEYSYLIKYGLSPIQIEGVVNFHTWNAGMHPHTFGNCAFASFYPQMLKYFGSDIKLPLTPWRSKYLFSKSLVEGGLTPLHEFHNAYKDTVYSLTALGIYNIDDFVTQLIQNSKCGFSVFGLNLEFPLEAQIDNGIPMFPHMIGVLEIDEANSKLICCFDPSPFMSYKLHDICRMDVLYDPYLTQPFIFELGFDILESSINMLSKNKSQIFNERLDPLNTTGIQKITYDENLFLFAPI